jgi:Zn-dependent M28 family amino/carboxypeptidase
LININFEMLGRSDPLAGGSGKLWLTGWEETTLGPQWAALGIALVQDPRPEQNFYRRSDNYAFVERGVMGQTLSSYNMHKDYHTVDDEVDRIEWEHLHKSALAGQAGLRALFDGEVTPAWVPKPEKKKAGR